MLSFGARQAWLCLLGPCGAAHKVLACSAEPRCHAAILRQHRHARAKARRTLTSVEISGELKEAECKRSKWNLTRINPFNLAKNTPSTDIQD